MLPIFLLGDRRFTKMLFFFLFLCYNGKNIGITPKGEHYGIIYEAFWHKK